MPFPSVHFTAVCMLFIESFLDGWEDDVENQQQIIHPRSPSCKYGGFGEVMGEKS